MYLAVQHEQTRAVQTIAVLTCRDGIRRHVICTKIDDYGIDVTRGGTCVLLRRESMLGGHAMHIRKQVILL